MQVLYNLSKIIKLLIFGFYREGIKILVKALLKNLFLVICALVLVIYLCINPKTSYISWLIIGLVAFIAAIKAIYEIFTLILKYRKIINLKEKELILIIIGGKLFDFAISIIGIFQAFKILRHTVRIIHAANSAISVIDDVIAAISNATKNFLK